jgi:hypothetical protein
VCRPPRSNWTSHGRPSAKFCPPGLASPLVHLSGRIGLWGVRPGAGKKLPHLPLRDDRSPQVAYCDLLTSVHLQPDNRRVQRARSWLKCVRKRGPNSLRRAAFVTHLELQLDARIPAQHFRCRATSFFSLFRARDDALENNGARPRDCPPSRRLRPSKRRSRAVRENPLNSRFVQPSH